MNEVQQEVYKRAREALHRIGCELIVCKVDRSRDLSAIHNALNLLEDKNGASDVEKALLDWKPHTDYITQVLGAPEVLAQLAEEAAELSQAALKLRRALDRRNPTPVLTAEAVCDLQEEFADVLLCMSMIGIDARAVERTIRAKAHRWATRLENGGVDDD